MLQLCSKITSVLLLFSIIKVKCCKREDLHYISITVKPSPLELHATKEVVSSYSTTDYHAGPLILATEGLSPCRENIQGYEESLKNVMSVEVRNHFVPILYHGDVQNLGHLENIYLRDNNIQEVQPGAFLNVPNLRIISLVNNTIEEIQGGVFNNLNLEKLYLQYNKISLIAPEAFDNMPDLVEIDLSNNLLTNWNGNWLTNAPKINKLLVYFNELNEIPAGAFGNTKNSLEVLDISNNKISNIDAVTLGELKKLRRLSLENNKFNCLSDDVLNALPERLTLSYAPNENMSCLCWNKLQKWSFKYYEENKDTIFFTVRHAEIQCNNEIVGMLHDALSRLSALEKH